MKALIRHVLSENLGKVVERSRLNCHAIGLHSLMLIESPGQTVRLFLAEENHELWKNDPETYREGMSIGFHAHHCNLTLTGLTGTPLNWVAQFDPHHEGELGCYLYSSALLGNRPGFSQVGRATKTDVVKETIYPGRSVWMSASQLHTVAVPRGQCASWFVFEGKENPRYVPLTYSTSDLAAADFSQLYQSMTAAHVQHLVRKFNLI